MAKAKRVKAKALTGIATITPPVGLGARPHLPERTRAKLDAFCEAHHGADPEVVIDKAVNKFMADDMLANDGIRKEYGWETPDKT